MTKRTKIVLSVIAGVVLVASLPILGGFVLGAMMAFSGLLTDLHYSSTQVKPAESEIVGSYKAQFGWGSAELILDSNHHFEETIVEVQQQPTKEQGSWKSEKDRFGTAVTFSPFVEVGETRHGKIYPNYGIKFSKLKAGLPFAELQGSSFTKQ